MFMWIIYAFASAFFAGVTSILAKCGIRKTDSNVATAIRTIVVLLFSWVMVFLVGSQATLSKLTGESLLYLVLSGLATGASWLCYFKALQLGDVNKVVPVDKSSTVLTILLAFFLLHEEITWQKAVGVAAIAAGTYLRAFPVAAQQFAPAQALRWEQVFRGPQGRGARPKAGSARRTPCSRKPGKARGKMRGNG